MGCRVGMSTTPRGRIEYWKKKEKHTHGKVLVSNLTYDEAQRRETKEARQRGCYSKPGGEPNGKSNWSVYHVWGGTTPVD